MAMVGVHAHNVYGSITGTPPPLLPTSKMPIYGQVVVGPPGAGKSTYCNGMQQYLKLIGRQQTWVLNLDPANDRLAINKADSYPVSPGILSAGDSEGVNANDTRREFSDRQYEMLWDVCDEMVNLRSVMEQTGLGPNGGLIYCIEYMEAHVDEMIQQIDTKMARQSENGNNVYLLLDLPGQVELYTHSTVVQRLLNRLIKQWDLRLAMVQLIDSHHCLDVTKFISAALLGTTTLLRLELPAVSVLSKMDLLSQFGSLPAHLELFLSCQGLDSMIPMICYSNELDETLDITMETELYEDPTYKKARQKRLDAPLARKYRMLHERLAEVVQDYSLLSFVSLDITQSESVARVLARVDQANGYVFTSHDSVNASMLQYAVRSYHRSYDGMADIFERVATQNEIPELRKQNMVEDSRC